MSIRNPNWYDLNSQRSWPLDAAASLLDDNGQLLPHDLIVDLYVSYPQSLGSRLFLATLTAGPHIVTATLLSGDEDFLPVAAISLPRPVDIGRHYSLEPLADGVGGWIVWGSGVLEDELRSYRFSSPAQSWIQVRSAQRYQPLPVTSLGKLFAAQGLQGLVRLQAGNDLEIVAEDREIEGVLRPAAVFRLRDSLDQGEGRNLLDIYRGPCGRRPESHNCGEPDPIEMINSVQPDCCGRIIIELRGCAAVSQVSEEGCSVVLDCGYGLGDACTTPDRLPDADGVLPNEYDDLCFSFSSEIPPDDSETPDPDPSYDPPPSDDDDLSDDLPYFEDFESGSAGLFDTVSGSAAVAVDNEGGKALTTSAGGGRTLAIVQTGFVTAYNWSTLYKQITANLTVQTGASGSKRNGGIVFNYRASVFSPSSQVFWVAELSWDGAKSFSLRKYNGAVYTYETVAAVAALALGNSYKVTITIEPVSETSEHAWVTARLEGNDDAIDVTLGPVRVLNYAPTDGYVGLHALESLVQLHDFRVENSPVP